MSVDTKKKLVAKKETHESLFIKEMMTIEPDMMGFVAGHKGQNVKRLHEIYGVDIILSAREGSQITIKGPAQMVSAAKKEIEENLSCKTIFFIEKDYTRMVIGKDGERIIALEAALNVDIKIHKDGEVVITGTRCKEAKKSIEENLSCVTSFFIEKDHIVILIGREGKNTRALVKALDIWIRINEENGEIVIRGARCEEARRIIEENLSQMTRFFIEKEYRYLVIEAEKINQLALEKAHDVTIHIKEDGTVLIMGKEGEKGKKAIESLIERFKAANPYQEKFSVPACMIRYFKGKGGSNVKRIESTYSVHVYTSFVINDEFQIVVKGSVARNVASAKQDVLEYLGVMILDLDVSFLGRIVGRGGKTVLRISKEFGVVIHSEQKNQGVNDRRKVYIFGEKDRTKAAKDDIISIITGRKKV